MENYRDTDTGISPVVGAALLVVIALILSVIIGGFVFGVNGRQDKPANAGVSYDGSSERVNAQIISADRTDTVTVKSPLGTRYKVSSPNPGESEGLVAFKNRKYTTIASYEGEEQVVNNFNSKHGFKWDVSVDKHGTEDYTSIQTAIDNASPGDVIAIEKATYKENVNVDKDVTLVAEDGVVIQDAAPAEDVLQITADGAQVYNTQVNCDPTTGDGHYARHGVNVQANNVRISGLKIKNCGLAMSGTQAGIAISGANTEISGNLVENSEVGLMVTDNAGSAVVKRNSFNGQASDIVNNGIETLDARRNHFDNVPSVKGIVDVSNQLSSFSRDFSRGPLQGGDSPLNVAGKMAVNTDSGTVFLQSGGPSVDWFDTKIKVLINGKAVVIRPVSGSEFTIVSSDSGVNPNNVFDSKTIGRSSSTFDGKTVTETVTKQDGSTITRETTKNTLSTGETLSLDFNENNVDMSGVKVVGSSDSGKTLFSAGASSSNTVSSSSVASSTKQQTQSTASFSVSAGRDYTVQTGSELTFIAGVDGLSSSEISSYEWQVDGVIASSNKEFTRTFDTAGEYQVSLRVTSTSGESAVDSITVTVSDSSSVTNLSPVTEVDNAKVKTGEQATLDASDSYDPDGSIASYEWDFDQDGKVDATGSSVTFPAKSTLGTYPVDVTVTDDDGATSTKTTEVLVDAPPTASFTYSPTEVAPGDTVTFDASGSTDNGDIVKYEWDIDNDGKFEKTGKTMQLTNVENKVYTITLRVTDENGFQSATSQDVSVEPKCKIFSSDTTLSAGTYNYECMVVESGVTLTLKSNLDADQNGNYGGVKFNVAGDVTINGQLNADGEGYVGAYDNGPTGPGMVDFSDGASYGGRGGGDSVGTYGSADSATRLGSGGSSSADGGGSVWINAGGDIELNGAITADGEDFKNNGAASGGSVRIETPGNLIGSGSITAQGGDAESFGGGGGRIYISATSIDSSISTSVAGGSASDYDPGQDGTKFINQNPSVSGVYTPASKGTPGYDGEFIAQAKSNDGDSLSYKWEFEDGTTKTGRDVVKEFTTTGDHTVTLRVSDEHGSTTVYEFTYSVTQENTCAVYDSDERLNSLSRHFPCMTVESGTTLTMNSDLQADQNGNYGGVKFNVDGKVKIKGTLNADGEGYFGEYDSGPTGPGMVDYSDGASYGGRGGGDSVSTYGSKTQATRLGSGGSSSANGGGSIWIDAEGDVSISGTITADGEDFKNNGAASGGSVRIETTGSVTGSGSITAQGGDAESFGGGGGRIYISASSIDSSLSLSAAGGSASDYDPGQDGTVYTTN